MKRLGMFAAVSFVLVMGAVCQAVITFEDGLSHLINDATYQNDIVWLDYDIANLPGTHVELSDNGLVGYLTLYNASTLNMTGGTIVNNLRSTGSSTVSISGGSMYDFYTLEDSVATITGGAITDQLAAGFNSTITMSGGSFGSIRAYYDSTIYLVGTGFEVDGQPLSYGDKLSDYGTYYSVIYIGPGYLMGYYSGTITGTLADGTSINNTFYVAMAGVSEIFVIPEPATLLLLGLGGMLVRKRRV